MTENFSIGRYSGPGRGLSQAGANYFTGAETKGGALAQGIGNALLSGAGEGVDILRDIYGAGTAGVNLLGKIPSPTDVALETAKYLASPSKVGLEEQKKQEALKLMRPFGPLQQIPDPYEGLLDDYEDADKMQVSTQDKITIPEIPKPKPETEPEPETKKTPSFESLFNASMGSYLASQGQEDTGKKTIEDYKKDFAEATGIDVSGKPDKSTALMALGLALMQNKAGKGFNVGKMLTAVGEAGEKALPVFEKAKQKAELGAAKAGEYALGKVDEDEAEAKLKEEEMRDRTNYYVIPKGKEGGPLGVVDAIMKGKGEF